MVLDQSIVHMLHWPTQSSDQNATVFLWQELRILVLKLVESYTKRLVGVTEPKRLYTKFDSEG